MKVRGLWLGILFVAAFSACRPTKPVSQGLKGQVFWLEGNLMPQAGGTVSAPQEKDLRSPVARRVVIHTLTTLDQLNVGDFLIGSIQTPRIAELETDENGRFEIELPIGAYSVFTVEEEGYFANVFDQYNHVNPIQVKEGEWTFLEIVVNYLAVY